MASRLSHSIGTHTRLWYLVDARDQVVGRLASMVALLLQGKNKPIYHPSVDMGDHVVIINTRHLVLTGSKWDNKLYRHHTGYPGGLREIVAKHLHQKDPTMILRRAVNGMLPKNLQRKHRLRRLHLFPDADHTHHPNITYQLPGPCPVFKTLSDYSPQEISDFPDLVKTRHL